MRESTLLFVIIIFRQGTSKTWVPFHNTRAHTHLKVPNSPSTLSFVIYDTSTTKMIFAGIYLNVSLRVSSIVFVEAISLLRNLVSCFCLQIKKVKIELIQSAFALSVCPGILILSVSRRGLNWTAFGNKWVFWLVS